MQCRFQKANCKLSHFQIIVKFITCHLSFLMKREENELFCDVIFLKVTENKVKTKAYIYSPLLSQNNFQIFLSYPIRIYPHKLWFKCCNIPANIFLYQEYQLPLQAQDRSMHTLLFIESNRLFFKSGLLVSKMRNLHMI